MSQRNHRTGTHTGKKINIHKCSSLTSRTSDGSAWLMPSSGALHRHGSLDPRHLSHRAMDPIPRNSGTGKKIKAGSSIQLEVAVITAPATARPRSTDGAASTG